MFFFFFFKQKTAYEMRISDWSSDVCSSDLWNQGLFSFVDETGAVQAKASQTTTISYSYATNVVKYDIDLPADTDADVHYNAVLDLFGDSKAYLQQTRYVVVQLALMASTLHNTHNKTNRF